MGEDVVDHLPTLAVTLEAMLRTKNLKCLALKLRNLLPFSNRLGHGAVFPESAYSQRTPGEKAHQPYRAKSLAYTLPAHALVWPLRAIDPS